MLFFAMVFATYANLSFDDLGSEKSLIAFRDSLRFSGKGLNEQGKPDACERNDMKYYVVFAIIDGNVVGNIGVCLDKSRDIFEMSKSLSKYSIFIEEPIKYKFSVYGKIFITLLCLHISTCLVCGLLPIMKPELSDSKFIRIFSTTEAMKVLLKTRENNDLGLFNGLRIISFVFVIYGHTLLIKLSTSLINIEEIGSAFKNWWGVLAYTGFFAVDVFFFISGFILSYFILIELVKSEGKLRWIMLYVHRIIRILPALAIAIGISNYVIPPLFSGPIWKNYHSSLNLGCPKYWWATMMFINNFLPDEEKNECFGTAWYIANDFQFFLIGPAIIYLYYKSKKKYLIWPISLLTFLSLFILSSMIAYHYSVSVNPIKAEEIDGVKTGFRYFYVKPYIRFPPYLQGLLLGLVYYHFKHKTEFLDDWISKRIVSLTENSKIFQMTCFASGIFIMVHCVLVQRPVYEDLFNVDLFGRWKNALLMSYFRFGFTFGLLLLVLLMLLGKAGLCEKVLNSQGFEILAKLTYSGYLYHIIILAVLSYMSHHTFIAGYFMLKEIVVFTVLSLLAGLASFVWIEIPFMNLEILFRKKEIDR